MIEKNERIRELSEQIEALEKERRHLIDEDNRRKIEKLRPLVGQCFRVDGGVAKIYDVPQPEALLAGPTLNLYQIPVIIVHDNPFDTDIPFVQGTLFSRAVDAIDPVFAFGLEYSRISPVDFEHRFRKAISRLFRMADIKEKE